MEINNLPQTQGAAGVSAASRSDDTAVLSSDFETFLVMLTAQIQNQDPLNPMDSSDYAVQLATFSGVEQQVLTNQLLRQMDGETADTMMLEMASLVGLEARTDRPVRFEGAPVTYELEMPPGAQWAKLVVSDGLGREVEAIDVPLNAEQVTWDGRMSDGRSAPDGSYDAVLHVYSGGEGPPEEVQVHSYTRINEVRLGSSGPEVVLQGGTSLRMDELAALRSPAPADAGS